MPQPNALKLITLLPEDDVVSLLDHLQWTTEDRVVFVADKGSQAPFHFANIVDLTRLRRAAERLRRQVGFVSDHPDLQRWATEAGLPVFGKVSAAERDERTWRRGRRPRMRLGLQPAEIRSHHHALQEQKHLAERRRLRPSWEYWVKRYAAIVASFLTLAGLIIGALYLIPRSVIHLQPATLPLQTELTLSASTTVNEVEANARQVPARVTTVTATWTTAIATTGSAAVPDTPGRGQIVLTNLTVDALNLPAGTVVSAQTAAGRVEFQTIQPVSLPDVVGATAAVDIVALSLGEIGNVPADSIRTIDPELAGKVELRNPEPTAGGAIRPVAAVSAADRERLRAQLTQYLQGQAIAQIEGGLAERELLARDTLRLRQIINESWSHEVGEATDSLSLTLTAELTGVVIDTTPAVDLVYNRLTQEVPPGYTLLPDSFVVASGDVDSVNREGTIPFTVQGRGQIAAEIDASSEISRIAGQNIDEAMGYLQEQFLLDTRPTATVFPAWFGRLPYLPSRIEVVVVEG